jgi:transcriptional regulator with XRE-family HTH domain
MEWLLETDYRTLLQKRIESGKKINPAATAQSIAGMAHVSKAYLSQVLNKRAHLNQDQLFAIMEFLDLTAEEKEFLVILLELNRSALKKRRSQLEAKLDAFRKAHLSTQSYLSAQPIVSSIDPISQFYLDPVNLLVHIALTIPRYLNDPSLLSEALDLSPERLAASLQILIRAGILIREKNRLRLTETHFHLPSDSPIYPAWRTLMKAQAFLGIQRCPKDDAYSFNVVFSANHKCRQLIQKKLLEAVSACEKEVAKSPKETVFQMSIDLFPWTR